MRERWMLVTGATGLIGGETLRLLLRKDPSLRAYALVRDLVGWSAAARRLGKDAGRVTPVSGDLAAPGMGLARSDRARLRRRVRWVLHAAANTSFSQPLAAARRINRDGTWRLLELALGWPGVERFAYVSTAFVAGRLTGVVPEAAHSGHAGWVNAYERSKHEAESLVRRAPIPWVILRPSTVVCDDAGGSVTQINAVHRALRLYHGGLASLLPGSESTPVDVVTNAYVSGAIAELAFAQGAEGVTYHLCSGSGALPLGEMLDRSHALWSTSAAWRRRGTPRPALTDLETYRLFERSVEETGDARLRRITRSLSHFVPQLALPKTFDTTLADADLGRTAPPVRTYWARMLLSLAGSHWDTADRRAA